MPEDTTTIPAPGKPLPKAAPKWETDARERIKAGIRTISKPLAGLIERDANEGDTRHLVIDFLCDVLGYDKYEDLTTEYQVKGEFADYGVRIDKDLSAFIEVKRVATKLGPKHLRQVEIYAINEGVEWGILTNGNDWQVHHLGAGCTARSRDAAIRTTAETPTSSPNPRARRQDARANVDLSSIAGVNEHSDAMVEACDLALKVRTLRDQILGFACNRVDSRWRSHHH